MNSLTSLSSAVALPDNSAFFADLLSDDPEIRALLDAAYGKGSTKVPGVTVTRSGSLNARPLIGGIKPGGRKSRANGDKPARAPKADKPAKEAKVEPILVELTWKSNGSGAARFLEALSMAGKRFRCYETDGVDVVSGECHSAGDPVLASNGAPLTYFAGDIAQRSDERAAIEACFDGSSRSEALGTQLDQARMLAQTAIRRGMSGKVEHRAFHYSGIDNSPRTVVHAVYHTGVVASAHPWRSPDAHSAIWSVEGYVKGLPRPIQKLLGDMCARERLATDEVITLGKLRAFVVAEDQESFESLMNREYPSSKEIETIFALDGITVQDYTVVEKLHPVVVALKRERGMRLLDRLAKLETFAAIRLAEVQRKIDAVEGGDTAKSIADMYAEADACGSIATLEESILSCYDPQARMYYTLPVGTVIPAGPIERLAAHLAEHSLDLTK
jgi:hypothetical protein